MSNLESETRRKLEILREAGFPIDQLAQSAVTGVVNQHQGQPDGLTSSTNESVKKDLSAILNSWVSGEIGDNDTLTKLFPLAVRYRYGDIDMMEFLKPEEQANLPLAKTVMAAWFAVVLQAPDAIQERFLEDYEEITDVHDLGMTASEFAAKFGKKGGPDHSR